MNTSHLNDSLRKDVQVVLQSKLEEFSLLGYGQVSEQEIWNFLIRKKWRKLSEPKLIHEIVEDILSVKVGEFFNFATVEAIKEAEFAFDNEEELQELLK
ncbi:post-transcriptional regulator [Bacillus sp. Bva_UNVM-123]|uniref:post-transcriptional regulator n=1 Tax=Bacillus sp. Bva_UNVM-123 TaxID=2829798 RepID=UPI00391F7432